MMPRPISNNPYSRGSGKLQGKVAIITGGDSGIGRAIAYAFAKEGADITISYLNEEEDACETKAFVEQMGRRCLLVPGDLKNEEMSKIVVEKTIECYGKIDILVNNHAVQFVQNSILDITSEQLDLTFRTNVYPFFYMTKAALKYLQRSLSQSLIKEGIRVNAVAPGPIWTPLIPASYSAEQVETFGSGTSSVPMDRAGQPFEVATSYVFLASDDSRYMSGQVLHPNGGTIVGS